ncbi:MAG: pyruvate formate-lyase-activating protein [Synechococcales bacterium]|nr:pyruvate formate-lyase-activating protein [Synechococcales bacterium]
MIHTIYPPASTIGRIHSIETCGTVDGPGLRYVIFMQGCALRCLYCHNPDSRETHAGREVTVEELITDIVRYRSYMQASGGGVTVSGGEPLLQPQFVAELLHRCQAIGLHTALDTSGYCDLEHAKSVLEVTDLVLLDIKSFDPEIYLKLTSVHLEPTLKLAQYLDSIHKPVWIRFVLVPGVTDAPHNIQGLADFIATLTNIDRVEILPFHKMGEYKWQQLGYDYQLTNTPTPTPEQIQLAIQQFQTRGIPAIAA